jgi:Peptidase family M28
VKAVVFGLVLLGFAVPGVAQTRSAKPSSAPASSAGHLTHALAGVNADAFRAHLAFLADDALEGRGTGTRGHEISALYVAAQFEKYGLEPMGDKGSYFQRIPFREITVVPEQCELILSRDGKEQALKWGDDFLMRGHELTPDARVEGSVVFVGYGVTAPNQNYDDYAGIDVRGKIVAYLAGAPARFPSEQRAHYGSGREKAKAAVAHGAIGIIALNTPEWSKSLPWERVIIGYAFPAMRWLGPDGMPNDAFPELRATTALSLPTSKTFFDGAPKSWDQVWADAQAGKPQAFPMPFTARLHSVSKHREISSPNVIAVLPGSDPRLKNEYVVYTAHSDHLGIGKPINGDSIYNGAIDNASGTAALLEIAETFSRLPQRPARSILFLAVTGEEKGLLGSDYYAHFPTVPKEAMVADINMDGATLTYDFADIVPFGAEHSSLMKVVRNEAKRFNVTVSPDPTPEQVYFIRSDQYSFVRQGIPAVFLSEGFHAVDPKIDGRAVTENWIKKYYHSPFDDMNQPLVFEAAVKFMKLNIAIGYDVANAPQRPTWNQGDFFGELYAGRRPAS